MTPACQKMCRCPSLPPAQKKNPEGSTEATSDKANSNSKSQAKHSSAAPAVHNLPIQALSGLIRPQYSDPRQVRQPGQVTQTQDNDPNGESDDKSLKDVFKTFDPTASPFCQQLILSLFTVVNIAVFCCFVTGLPLCFIYF